MVNFLKINFNIFILSLKNLRFNFARILLIFLGIISINIILYFLIALAIGVKTSVIDAYLETIPVNEIIVSKQAFVMNLPILNNFSFTSKKEINDTVLTQIRDIKGVAAVEPVLNINFPVSILIELFGYKFKSDLAVSGIAQTLINSDNLTLTRKFEHNIVTDKIIPALVSYNIIDLYNMNFAEANNLPKLSYKSVIGRHFTLTFGVSSFGETAKVMSIRCEIVGLSKRAELLGLTIPLDTVKQLNLWFNNKYIPEYSNVYVRTEKVSQIKEVSEKINKLGFNAFSMQDIVSKINNVGLGIIAILSIVIFSISIAVLFNIFNYYLTLIKSQENDIRILRLIGFSIANIRKIYLFQAFISSITISIFSMLISRIIIKYANNYVSLNIKKFAGIELTLFFTHYYIDIILSTACIFIILISVFAAVRKGV